jgi:hypothetical protein
MALYEVEADRVFSLILGSEKIGPPREILFR